MIEINKIYCSDNIEFSKQLDSNSIDLVVTSPPYDKLRDYKGYSWNFEELSKELFRVIKLGGVVVWVVGDATINGSETGTSFKQALYFKEVGFNLHDTMIYSSPKPPLTHNRYEQKFEYMFIFTKGKLKTFNPIKENCVNFGKSNKGTIRKTGAELLPKNKPGTVSEFKIKGNIWHYSTGCNKSSTDKIAHEHPAIFPEQLVNDHIISWSNKGDLVYDPFMGSGTVAKMARLLGRNFIGCDISKEYCEIAEKRLNNIDFIPELQFN